MSGKPDALCSCHSESNQNTFFERDKSNEPGNRFESSVHSVLRFSTPANVKKSLLDGKKDSLFNQAGSELMKRNIKWNLLTIVSTSLDNRLMLKKWNWRTPITDILNLEENKLDYKRRIVYEGKKRFEILR